MDEANRNRVFISYAHEDLDAVRQVAAGLKKRKLNVWFDKEDLRPGRFKPQITKAINRSRYFIICISEATLRKTGEEPGFQDNELQIAYEIALAQADTEFSIVPVRLEEFDRGDFRISSFQQYDLFPNFEEGLDKLAVSLGGLSLANVTAQDERLEDEKEIDRLTGKVATFLYAGYKEQALNTLDFILEKYSEVATDRLKEDYETKIKVLEGQREQLIDVISKLADKPKMEVIMGDKIITKDQKGNAFIVKDKGVVVKYINEAAEDLVSKIAEAIQQSDSDGTTKKDAREQLDKIDRELQKPNPEIGRLQRCWDYISKAVPKVGEVVPWKKLIEKFLIE